MDSLPICTQGKLFVQGNVLRPAASFLGIFATGVIRQNHAHDLGREGIEVSAIRPVCFLLADQAQVDFVNQDRSLEQAGLSLPPDVRSRNLAQVGIHQRHQLLKGIGFTLRPFVQEQRYLT
jgi:hypothetical protein